MIGPQWCAIVARRFKYNFFKKLIDRAAMVRWSWPYEDWPWPLNRPFRVKGWGAMIGPFFIIFRKWKCSYFYGMGGNGKCTYFYETNKNEKCTYFYATEWVNKTRAHIPLIFFYSLYFSNKVKQFLKICTGQIWNI